MSADAETSLRDNILTTCHTVAVVGASDNADRPSHRVVDYLGRHGFNVIPVNPTTKQVMGLQSYPDLKSIPEKVEVVDIFRRPEETPAIVEDAIAIGAKAVWMQEGVVNEEAAARARKAGLLVVMDKCMRKEHMRLTGLSE